MDAEEQEAGHGGSDLVCVKIFADAIRKKQEPPFDIHTILNWTLAELLSENSLLAGGAPVKIPDLRQEG